MYCVVYFPNYCLVLETLTSCTFLFISHGYLACILILTHFHHLFLLNLRIMHNATCCSTEFDLRASSILSSSICHLHFNYWSLTLSILLENLQVLYVALLWVLISILPPLTSSSYLFEICHVHFLCWFDVIINIVNILPT